MTIKGTSGNDVLNGTSKADTFDLSQGGNDTVNGEAGNDKFIFGSAFTAKDSVNGGSGNDTLSLSGDYTGSHKVSFGAKTIVSVETIVLGTGHSYSLTTNDANVAKNKTLTVDASKLAASDTLAFNGSHETNGKFDIIGGKGNDTLTGGAKNDTFDLSHGGNDTANGGGGNDIFNLGAAFTAADKINGGTGNDVVNLDGTYTGSHALTFGAKTLLGVEKITLGAGHNYSLTTSNATVAGGATLTVDAHALGSGNSLTFNAYAETDGSYHITGGSGADTFDMGGLTGADSINGGAGSDTLALFDTAAFYDGFTLNGAKLISIDKIVLTDGTYNFTTAGNLAASGSVMTIDASALSGSNSLNFDASSETTGGFHFIGGAWQDTITISSQNVLSHSTINGGPGFSDNLVLNGDFSNGYTFGADQLTNLVNIVLDDGNDYVLTTADGNVASGAGMGLNAEGLSASHFVTFDASAETDGYFDLRGGAGNDTFILGNRAVFAGSDMYGDGGNDTVELKGDFSTQTTLTGSIMNGIGTLKLDAGHDYSFNTTDGLLASGDQLTVNGQSLGAGDTLTFDGSAETDGRFNFYLGAGHNTITGGSGADFFEAETAGHDVFSGGAGTDEFLMGGDLDTNDSIDGGTGNDYVVLDGTYSGLTISSAMMQNIAALYLDAAGSGYDLAIGDGVVASGHTLTINASTTDATNPVTLDVSAATAGGFAITGGAGGDTVTFGNATVFGNSSFDGGSGNDTLVLNGDYSGGMTLNSAILTGVEKIALDDGHNYDLTTADDLVGSGDTLTVDASALTGSHRLLFDGSAETDGHFDITGGAGTDTVTIGSASVLAGSTIDGGGSSNEIFLDGDFSGGVTLGPTTITNFMYLYCDAGHNYNITTSDNTVAAGHEMAVQMYSANTSDTHTLTFNGSAETDGSFTLEGGAGNDILTGGDKSDLMFLYDGGSDTLDYTAVAQSTSVNYDTIEYFDASNDKFELGFSVASVGSATASINAANFDSDIASAFVGTNGEHDAVLIHATSGTDSGDYFLVVDANGDGAYTGGQDFVFNMAELAGTLSTSDFI